MNRDNWNLQDIFKNIEEFNLSSRINVIYGDAMDTNVDGKFDLIFIDASKGHSIDFFEKYMVNLNKDGVISEADVTVLRKTLMQ